MATSTYNSVTVPAGTDLYNLAADLKTMAESATVIIPVANTTARAAVTSAAAPSFTQPIFVFRADAPAGERLEMSVDLGSDWDAYPVATPWQTLTLSAGWAAQSGYSAIRYRRLGSSVQITGTLLERTGSGLAVTPTQFSVGQLPAGFRPSAAIVTGGQCGVDGSLVGAIIEVNTSGYLSFIPFIGSGTIETGGGLANHVAIASFNFEVA